MGFFKGLFGFPMLLHRVSSRLGGSPLSAPVTVASILLALLFIALHLGEIAAEGCWSLALVAYITFAAVVSVLRTQVNEYDGDIDNEKDEEEGDEDVLVL